MKNVKRVLDAHAKGIIDSLGTEFDSHDFIEQFSIEHEREYVELLCENKDSVNGIFRIVHAKIGRFLSDNVSVLKIQKDGKASSRTVKGYKSANQRWKKVFVLIPLLCFLCNFNVLSQRFDYDELYDKFDRFWDAGSYKDIEATVPRAIKYLKDLHAITDFVVFGSQETTYFLDPFMFSSALYNVTDSMKKVLDKKYLESGEKLIIYNFGYYVMSKEDFVNPDYKEKIEEIMHERRLSVDYKNGISVVYYLRQNGKWSAAVWKYDLFDFHQSILFKDAFQVYKKQNLEMVNQVRVRNGLPELRSEEEEKQLEEKKQAEARVLEEKYQAYISEAEGDYWRKDYDKAKTAYKNALSVNPDQESYISSKIKEIDEIKQLLKEREYKVYDYYEIMPEDYDKTDAQIIEQLQTELMNNMFMDEAEVVITCEIDMDSDWVSSFKSSITEPNLKSKLRQISKKVTLEQPSIKGYTVASKAEFVYDVSGEQAIIKVKKNATGTHYSSRKYNTYKSYIDKAMTNAPDGEFSWQYNTVFINNESYISDKLLKYKGAGGPGNAFLSLLVPGWGDRYVTAGAKSGVKTALLTYGLIGAGIGCKIISNDEYAKYHKDTEQSLAFNKAFSICVVTGAAIWISDIIYVWRRGTRNQREQNAFKRSHLGFYYQPEFEAKGLTYSVNF